MQHVTVIMIAKRPMRSLEGHVGFDLITSPSALSEAAFQPDLTSPALQRLSSFFEPHVHAQYLEP